MSSRLNTLLKEVHLDDNWVANNCIDFTNVDYLSVDRNIEAKRNESLLFLENALAVNTN